jgi:hypothetical protein
VTPPTLEQHRVLQNLAEGLPPEAGFIDPDDAVPALFQCITNGWVSGGRMTTAGRAALAGREPVAPAAQVKATKVTFECRVVERSRTFLAPVDGPAEILEENRSKG